MFNFGVFLIQQFDKYGYKCYIEKGTKRAQVNEEEKTVLLDLALPDFKEKAEAALEAVKNLYIRDQIQKARSIF